MPPLKSPCWTGQDSVYAIIPVLSIVFFIKFVLSLSSISSLCVWYFSKVFFATPNYPKNAECLPKSCSGKFLFSNKQLLWHELHYHKTAGNADDIYRIICIRNESVQDSETNTLHFFVSAPVFA